MLSLSEEQNTGRLSNGICPVCERVARQVGEVGQLERLRDHHDSPQVMISTGFGVGNSCGSAEGHPVEKFTRIHAQTCADWMLHFERQPPLVVPCMILSGLRHTREWSLPDYYCLPRIPNLCLRELCMMLDASSTLSVPICLSGRELGIFAEDPSPSTGS
jgi:hypothetical protein